MPFPFLVLLAVLALGLAATLLNGPCYKHAGLIWRANPMYIVLVGSGSLALIVSASCLLGGMWHAGVMDLRLLWWCMAALGLLVAARVGIGVPLAQWATEWLPSSPVAARDPELVTWAGLHPMTVLLWVLTKGGHNNGLLVAARMLASGTIQGAELHGLLVEVVRTNLVLAAISTRRSANQERERDFAIGFEAGLWRRIAYEIAWTRGHNMAFPRAGEPLEGAPEAMREGFAEGSHFGHEVEIATPWLHQHL